MTQISLGLVFGLPSDLYHRSGCFKSIHVMYLLPILCIDYLNSASYTALICSVYDFYLIAMQL